MVLLAFVGLSVKLITINKNNGEQYKKQVLSQQQYESVTIPFKRGDILDSKGTKLAASEKVYNLVIDTKNLLKNEDFLEPTLTALKTCFTDFDESAVRSYISTNPTSQYYVVIKKLTYDEISPFVQMD